MRYIVCFIFQGLFTLSAIDEKLTNHLSGILNNPLFFLAFFFSSIICIFLMFSFFSLFSHLYGQSFVLFFDKLFSTKNMFFV